MTNIILTQLVLATIGPEGLPGRVKNNYSLESLKIKAAGRQNKMVTKKIENLDKLAEDMFNKVISVSFKVEIIVRFKFLEFKWCKAVNIEL